MTAEFDAMCREIEQLRTGRFVVSEANKEIVTTLLRAFETLAYGKPRTPTRLHHHGEDDPTGLPTAQVDAAREAALAKLSPSDKRALGLPG